MSELLRFLAVTVLGVLIDLAIAFALHAGLGVPLGLAAAIAFTLAASLNYIIHQIWSFRSGPLSLRRAGAYALVALATMAVRVGIVAQLDRVLAGDYPLAILICGAGGSFVVNFVLSKWVVFAAAPTTAGDAP